MITILAKSLNPLLRGRFSELLEIARPITDSQLLDKLITQNRREPKIKQAIACVQEIASFLASIFSFSNQRITQKLLKCSDFRCNLRISNLRIHHAIGIKFWIRSRFGIRLVNLCVNGYGFHIVHLRR
jgi:hypothetical protein